MHRNAKRNSSWLPVNISSSTWNQLRLSLTPLSWYDSCCMFTALPVSNAAPCPFFTGLLSSKPRARHLATPSAWVPARSGGDWSGVAGQVRESGKDPLLGPSRELLLQFAWTGECELLSYTHKKNCFTKGDWSRSEMQRSLATECVYLLYSRHSFELWIN